MTNQKKLDDGMIAQAILPLAQSGEPVFPHPTFQQDLIGNLQHGYPDKVRGFTFGKRTLIANAEVDLWEGPTARYVFPTGPMRMQLSVTSVEDGVAGTGIRELHIHYLDFQYKDKSTIIVPSGNPVAPVLTVPTDILRINGMHATKVGSAGNAVGDISLTNLAGTVTYAIIKAGENTARQAIYTVPDGFYGYINHWQTSSGSTGNHFCQISLRATTHLGVLYPDVFLLQDEQGSQNGGNPVDFPIPIPIPARTDVKISAIADAPNANVTALGAIMGWFEPIPVA